MGRKGTRHLDSVFERMKDDKVVRCSTARCGRLSVSLHRTLAMNALTGTLEVQTDAGCTLKVDPGDHWSEPVVELFSVSLVFCADISEVSTVDSQVHQDKPILCPCSHISCTVSKLTFSPVLT
jgi:hypothetical protein